MRQPEAEEMAALLRLAGRVSRDPKAVKALKGAVLAYLALEYGSVPIDDVKRAA